MTTTKIVGILIAVAAGLLLLSLLVRGTDTASRMADQTVFNASKHVWSYEEFHRKHAQYEQYSDQITSARAEMALLEKKGTATGQRYDNLAMELDGARNMIKRIAAEYNAMSQIAYQSAWKSKGLPDRLE